MVGLIVTDSPSLGVDSRQQNRMENGHSFVEDELIFSVAAYRVNLSPSIIMARRIRLSETHPATRVKIHLRPKTMMVMSSFWGLPLANLRTSARMTLPRASACPPVLAFISSRSRSTP